MPDARLSPAEWGPGARFLVVLASAVVVVAGLRAAAAILLPFFLAFFLAILSIPIMLWLQRRGVPPALAILLAVMVDIGVLSVIVLLASQSFADFQDRLPRYATRLQTLFDSWTEALQARGVPADQYLSDGFLSANAIMDFVGGLLGRVAVFLSNTFIVILVMVFILAEATIFPKKFRAILGEGDGDLGRFAKITTEVLEYLVIKTLVSLATGFCIGVWAWIMGLDFPILLGLIGFILNYVPTIGSILAAAPAILLSLIQFGGLGSALLVTAGYVGINVVFGNLIEPHLLGRRLGLSTLVVILSLIFWAWAWGPVGALLAVPLTMVVKIMLENTEDLRWVAVLLDQSAPEPAAAASGGAAGTDIDGSPS
jgi:predicted PurR-regulated permease PerM